MQASTLAGLASERMSYPKALCGRYEPRQDLPEWMRVPRWCTTDAPRWQKGKTAELVDGFADRHAGVLRLGMFWGGLSHYPSSFAPHSPKLPQGVDPLAEAIATVRERNMHVLAYINPNACYTNSMLHDTACLMDESGQPWDKRAYGREGTRYACINHPAFARFYTAAIRELVGEYATDGIYVDGLSPHVCYCEHCRRKFARDTGRELPAGLTKLGPLSVLWEMTSDWDVVGDVTNPDHVLYSRWLMKCLTDMTRTFAETAEAARAGAVAVFHSWPKPDTLPYYDGTLNEIYAKRPWNFTLWKRAEFSNWGDVFGVPSLVNIYLRQEAWGAERRPIKSETEARHLYWQALANGAYPNAWAYNGMALPFRLMSEHLDCFDFPTVSPARSIALPRPMFHDARHRAVGGNTLLPLKAGAGNRLRILEREPGGRVDMLCFRADGREPSDVEARRAAETRPPEGVLYLAAAAFEAQASVTAAGERRWRKQADPRALSGCYMTSSGHGNTPEPRMPLEYALPSLPAAGPWTLWARVVFPTVGTDSFYWQVSDDRGTTWYPEKPRSDCALGWEQPQEYAWVKARAVLRPAPDRQVDRFLSPGAGMFAALLHAGLPVKQMHPNHVNRQSIEGFRLLTLANETCLSEEQCHAIRDFVRRGGGLIATHETSLYDLRGRRRSDLGLADLFGVNLRGSIRPNDGQAVQTVDANPLGYPPLTERVPNHEEHLHVEPVGARVVAWLTGPGVPGGEVPAVLVQTYGNGRVVYLPGRLDSSYSLWREAGFVNLVRGAALWAANSRLPVQAAAPGGIVGVTCFEQPARARWLIHLVAYNVDWTGAFSDIPDLTDVSVVLTPPEGRRLAQARAVRAGQLLPPRADGPQPELLLPLLHEYEIIKVTWR